MERRVDSITLRLVEGDICERAVDAIVNAANDELWMGAGVAGAIKRRGGEAIEREAVAKGPLRIGDAVETSAGDLGCRYVIHAAVMGQHLVTDADGIREATTSALQRARALGLKSIAFPALGTGVGGFPLAECARIMCRAVVAHAREETSLSTVEFVLFGREAYRAFARALEME